MKLLEFVPYLTHPHRLSELYRQRGIDQETESLSIYMQDVISLDSDIRLFTDEEVDGEAHVTVDGISYKEMLPVDLALGLIETDASLQHPTVTDLARAERIIEYSLYDA